MTRKGDIQRSWTTREIVYLKEYAGHLSTKEMHQAYLSRHTVGAIRTYASSALQLSLRCPKSTLAWCDRCGKLRVSVNLDGLCRVCANKQRKEARTQLRKAIHDAKFSEAQEAAAFERETSTDKQRRRRENRP
jgi:hypothetical protein